MDLGHRKENLLKLVNEAYIEVKVVGYDKLRNGVNTDEGHHTLIQSQVWSVWH